jgi:outer membrane lipoprotein SlyB
MWIGFIAAAAFALPAGAQVEYRYQENAPGAEQEAPAPQQQAPAAPAVRPSPPAGAAAPCPDCGTVDSVRVVEQGGDASGVGMIAGGVLGGLLGHQIGSGRGNTAATIIGAAGGAYAGHQVEKNVKKGARFDVGVRMPDGSLRTVSYEADPGFKTGDRVRFVDGRLVRNW